MAHGRAELAESAFERDAVAEHRGQLLVEEGEFVEFHVPSTLRSSASLVIPRSTKARPAVSSEPDGAIAASSWARSRSRIGSPIFPLFAQGRSALWPGPRGDPP